MSKTARLSEETHRQVKELADEQNQTVSETLDQIIAGELDAAGISLGVPVLGYCPIDGYEFRERDREGKLFGPDQVTCPVPSHQNGPSRTTLNVDDLLDSPPEHVDGPIRHTDLDNGEELEDEQ